MRATLEQLKAMSGERLFEHWAEGLFPFEFIRSCGRGCLTQHAYLPCKEHSELGKQVERMNFRPGDDRTEFMVLLKDHLEELYALRLFYNNFYEKEQETVNVEAPVATSLQYTEAR